MKTALITGIFGQDGSYLAELLQAKGYAVHGVARAERSSQSVAIAQHLASRGVRTVLHVCDLLDYDSVAALFSALQPDECYHLAAVHYASSTSPEAEADAGRQVYEVNLRTGANCIFAVRAQSPRTRLVLAGSCLMYDALTASPQRETMPFASHSMYGLAKAAVAELARGVRASAGLHVSNAILYNHESPRRGDAFVTQKIARQVARIKRGDATTLTLANLDSRKDWGHAADYVQGLWRMAQQATGDDYILATGETHSVEEFVGQAFEIAQVPRWRDHVRLDASLVARPPLTLVGDARKARDILGWSPQVAFPVLVQQMVTAAMNGRLD